jgi:hypothetical protein
MLTNEILKYPTNIEWTVINPHDDNRKRSEDSIETVRNNRVLHGFRVNGLRYAVTARWSDDINQFPTTNERSYGFLVKFLNATTGRDYYAVVKPTNFVAPRSEYDAYWVAENERLRIAREIEQAEYAKQQERSAQRRAVENERQQSAQPEAERVAQGILDSIRTMLGQTTQERSNVRINVQGEWVGENTEHEQYKVKQYGSVTMELQDFQRLMERALQD